MALPIEPYSQGEIDIATDQAMATILWLAGDEIYPHHEVDEFAPSVRRQVRELLAAFMETYLADLVESGHYAGWQNNIGKIGQIGHDYVLTTGGHGTGFWDRGLGDAGDRLADACRAEREEWNVYLGDDGVLYVHGMES